MCIRAMLMIRITGLGSMFRIEELVVDYLHLYFEELIVINLFLMTHHYFGLLLLQHTDQSLIEV